MQGKLLKYFYRTGLDRPDLTVQVSLSKFKIKAQMKNRLIFQFKPNLKGKFEKHLKYTIGILVLTFFGWVHNTYDIPNDRAWKFLKIWSIILKLEKDHLMSQSK